MPQAKILDKDVSLYQGFPNLSLFQIFVSLKRFSIVG